MGSQEVGEYNPVELEKKILGYWRDKGIPEKTLRKKRGELFSFLEGPPTANAPPALHHVEVRVFKDLVNRFQNMRGFRVPRKAGWDCHGLPVEVQVEKKLGLKSKKQIIDYGVDRFVEQCRESVFSHIKKWDELTDRMAYWIDLQQPYVTMDNDYIESVWWSLKQIHEKGLLYEGHRVVPYCTRCGTPLSSHEVALGYQSVKEQTVIVSFPVKEEDFSLLAWTTTPWTLLSNVALAVNPEIEYAKILFRGEKYVLASNLAENRFPDAEILERFRGQELKGLEYHPLFNHFIGKLDKPAWRVVSAPFVTTEEGTGIVHIAPAFGEDDYNVAAEHDLAFVNPIDEEGNFTEEIPELQGVFAKDADEKIIGFLGEMQRLITQYPYEHDYPFCWRCKKPLLYYAMKSWFIKVTEVADRLMMKNQQISWHPGHIKEGRFGKWLESARDWSLSRNRFWGTPLPIWRCMECGETKVIGSRQELSNHAKEKMPRQLDLHRPYVDEILLSCGCGGNMRREEYVIDCWYDSGSAPFAQFHYPFENKDLFSEHHPYDFISEATDQTRGWFYTLLVLSTILFDEPAYRSCVVGGLLLDENGEKMSKSNQNIIDPWELFDSVGADAVRMHMCSTAPWNAVRFGTQTLNQEVVPTLRTLWNCYRFTARYMALDGFKPEDYENADPTLEVEDKWILSKLADTQDKLTNQIDERNFHHALNHLNEFVIEDFSRWYIKIIRGRLWMEDQCRMNESKTACYKTLIEVFNSLCRLTAPYAPFISEEIYLNLVGGESVHLEDWPSGNRKDEQLLRDMQVAKKVFEAGSNLRQKAGIKLRHPIQKIYVCGGEKIKQSIARVEGVILKQLNAKKIQHTKTLEGASYKASPDFSEIGPIYGRDAPKVAQAIKNNPLEAKKILQTKGKGSLGGFEVGYEMVSEVALVAPEKFEACEFTVLDDTAIVYIETERGRDLILEALARDLIRHIQELRKKRDLKEMDQISVWVSDSPQINEMLGGYKNLIKKETRAQVVEAQENLETKYCLDFEGKHIYYDFSL
ncbi:MAG: isoleucine--tRNA ligase [Candidatus Altiarchaeales archaeon]|nr:isoleucine--tRNA ligase [Candidatus Altiarchaeales archaeon]